MPDRSNAISLDDMIARGNLPFPHALGLPKFVILTFFWRGGAGYQSAEPELLKSPAQLSEKHVPKPVVICSRQRRTGEEPLEEERYATAVNFSLTRYLGSYTNPQENHLSPRRNVKEGENPLSPPISYLSLYLPQLLPVFFYLRFPLYLTPNYFL